MAYIIEGDNVYYEDEHMKHQVGTVNKTVVERIDASTVADVTYQFDLSLGEYVEQSRTTRAEPLPPVPPTVDEQINQLKSRLAATEQSAADTSLTLQQYLESVL